MGLLKSLIFLLLLVIAVGTPLKPAAAQPSPPSLPAAPDSALPTLDPARVIDLPMRSEWSGVDALAFSPSGQTLFALQPVPAINLWAAYVVWYWPEIFAGATTLAGLFFLVMLRRILKRPRTPGLPYCRACNYCLHHSVSPRCPECGVALDAKSPVRGRHWLLRIAPSVILFALIGGVWGRLVYFQTQRVNAASGWAVLPWETDDHLLDDAMNSPFGLLPGVSWQYGYDDARALMLSRIYTIPIGRDRIYSFRTAEPLSIAERALIPISDDRILLCRRNNFSNMVATPVGAVVRRLSQSPDQARDVALSRSLSRAVTSKYAISPGVRSANEMVLRIRDLDALRPRALISLPASAYLQQLALSDDGNTLAVAATLAPEESWKQEHTLKIYLFDLSGLAN